MTARNEQETTVTAPAPALPQETYAPEVFERMKALLQEAHGSPMRALRLAVSTPQVTMTFRDDAREAMALHLWDEGLVRPESLAFAVVDEFIRGGWTVSAPQDITDDMVERFCETMHDAYEEAAVREGWSTQQASRKPWAEVPEANRRTMRYAVRAALGVSE